MSIFLQTDELLNIQQLAVSLFKMQSVRSCLFWERPIIVPIGMYKYAILSWDSE